MASAKRSGSLDAFRLIAAFLVVAVHVSPLSSFNETADFVLTRIFARVAVPFFFMVTGYFCYAKTERGDRFVCRTFLKKNALLYAAAILLYLPLNIYAGYFRQSAIGLQIGKDILVNGTFYHLWYFPAVLFGVFFTAILIEKAGLSVALMLSAILYAIGLGGDSYYGFAAQLPFLKVFYTFLFEISEYTRNGLFFAPFFLVLGAVISLEKKSLSKKQAAVGLGISAILFLFEGLLLHMASAQRHDSMYVMLVPVMYFLFQLLLHIKGFSSKKIRLAALLIYILHPWAIVSVRGVAKVLHLQAILVDNSLIQYIAVCLFSLAASLLFVWVWDRFKKPPLWGKERAWVEIDLAALRHNVTALQKQLPESCRLMAVVKANAYGHGDLAVAKALGTFGIDAFAVSTLEEGIRLRKHGIRGVILILGYTDPREIASIRRFHLTQAVIDYAYAKELNKRNVKIDVHIKIDTGMHRLGIDCSHPEEILSIYRFRNLSVRGMFSHLCVSDSQKEEDIAYTKGQIDRFFQCVQSIKSQGFDTGKVHIQATYGILNYPGLPCDYARAGIGLYGVLSSYAETLTKPDLRPVLSLKARIAMVRQIEWGDSVGYGRQYTATSDRRIAVVTIGYADGIPRNLADSSCDVLLHGQRAPIIGRICMDQLMIDVTGVPEVQPGDVVTLIGSDGSETIRCEDVAAWCGTISNEILSRLGNRLSYIVC